MKIMSVRRCVSIKELFMQNLYKAQYQPFDTPPNLTSQCKSFDFSASKIVTQAFGKFV